MSVPCGTYEPAFTLDDPDVLVEASLACPACLASDTAIDVGPADPGPTAHGSCAACGSTWSLRLAPQQLLRLGLDPPAGTRVRLGAVGLLPDFEERHLDGR